MNDRINELISDIYYVFNSACIVDHNALTISTPETTLHFNNVNTMNEFLLDEIKRSIESC